MVETKLQFFTVNEVIGNLIASKVIDIFKDRKGNRWVYPTFPEEDSELPEVVVEVEAVSYEPDSAGNFLYEETLPNGDLRKYYYKKAIYPVHIYVITGRKDEFTVLENGKDLFLSNKPLNIYLTLKIVNVLRVHRGEMLLKHFDGFDEQSVSPAFEDNKSQWASDIMYEVKAKDVWVKEFHKGEIIRDYSLAVNLIT